MAKSHATEQALDALTPDKIESGKITKDHIPRGEVQVSASFTTDLSKYSLKVEREGPPHPEGVTVADLDVKKFLCRDEKYISGEELQKRVRGLGAKNLGLHTAEYLLEHQDEMLMAWRGKYLVFLGTELRDSDGRRRVPLLYWDGRRWSLIFLWLGRRFYSSDYFVRLRA